MEEWRNKIMKGMRLISKGCKEKDADCCDCPFKKVCIAFIDIGNDEIPYIEDWEDIYGTP